MIKRHFKGDMLVKPLGFGGVSPLSIFAERAIELGMEVIACPTPRTEEAMAELETVRDLYAGDLQILTVGGIGDIGTGRCDLVLGELGMIELEGVTYHLPRDFDGVRRLIFDACCDIHTFFRAYFEQIAGLAERYDVDVIRFGDLLPQWCVDGVIPDADERRILQLMIRSVDALLKKGIIFEVRANPDGQGSEPILYPRPEVLMRIGNCRGSVMLTSGAERAQDLGRSFSEASAMLRACGIGGTYIRRSDEWEQKSF